MAKDGLSHVVPELFKKAYFAKYDTLDVFSPNLKRTFCYIDDAVEMMRLLAESDDSIGQAFNMAMNRRNNYEELAQKIVKITGKTLNINPQPVTAGSP